MQTFSGFDYLLLDVAGQFGLDKEKFDDRLTWAKANYDQFELLISEAPVKTRPAYEKAVQTVRQAVKGEPVGHRVGMDAICSGMQIMSALTRCEKGCMATGLIDTGVRPNAYTAVADRMAHYLAGQQMIVAPEDVKKAVMNSLYGSKATPRRLFGNPDPEAPPTPELIAFYSALGDVAPGASELMDQLLNLWQPFALKHEWVLPDGHVSSVKVMVAKEKRLRVEELNNASLTYIWRENEGTDFGLSLIANVTHSVDAYILRCLVRQCMYDKDLFITFKSKITADLNNRTLYNSEEPTHKPINTTAAYLQKRFEETQIADVLILDHLSYRDIESLSTKHLEKLLDVMNRSLEHEPFETICVHDEFTAHPNNLNYLRNHYRNILADLSESTLLTDVFQQISGLQGEYELQKSDKDITALIRQSNYSLS